MFGILYNPNGDVVIHPEVWNAIKKLIRQETGPDPEPQGIGFIALAKILGLESCVWSEKEETKP